MRILMLAWEYPPDHVGGLGRHVYHLSQALGELGADVTVLARSRHDRPPRWKDGDVTIVSAVPYDLHPPDFVTWAAQYNVAMLEALFREAGPHDFDVVHAHDWIVAYGARAIKHTWGIPLVATIHATEAGRQKGLHTPMQHHISETEWWLCYEAWRVITCSRYMRDEVSRLFSVPLDKVRVLPNGISDEWFQVQRNLSPDPVVLYVGRLVPEKGPHTLVECMPDVLAEFPSARLVLAGAGSMENDLRRRIYELGLGKAVELVGHVDDTRLRDLYGAAWVAAFPSSYEPFGIVALEAMATGVPCIVGDSGGLAEIVENGVTGLKVRPDDPQALSWAIRHLLRNERLRHHLSIEARERVRKRYSWRDIAAGTLSVYEEVVGARRRSYRHQPRLSPIFQIRPRSRADEGSRVAGSSAGGGGQVAGGTA